MGEDRQVSHTIATRAHPRAASVMAIALMIAFVAAPSVSGAEPKPLPIRGVWLQPYAIANRHRAATLDKVKRLHLNTIYLRTPTIEAEGVKHHGQGDLANFEATLKALRKQGVAVHAWITNKMRAGGEQVDFTDVNERKLQAQWAIAILDRWPALAGVHLDYIRYSKWDKPDARRMDAVTATVRGIREAINKKYSGKQLTGAVFTADFSYLGGRWGRGGARQWDGDVPAWFQQWHHQSRGNVYTTRPALLHKQGKFNDFGLKHLYGPVFFHMQQDPVTWLKEDLLDSIQVMQYSADRERWRIEAETWKAFMTSIGKDAKRVHLGLGWLTEKGQPDWRRDAAAMADHVKVAKKVGLGGVSIFTLGVEGIDDEPLVRALRPAMMPATASQSGGPSKEAQP